MEERETLPASLLVQIGGTRLTDELVEGVLECLPSNGINLRNLQGDGDLVVIVRGVEV